MRGASESCSNGCALSVLVRRPGRSTNEPTSELEPVLSPVRWDVESGHPASTNVRLGRHHRLVPQTGDQVPAEPPMGRDVHAGPLQIRERRRGVLSSQPDRPADRCAHLFSSLDVDAALANMRRDGIHVNINLAPETVAQITRFAYSTECYWPTDSQPAISPCQPRRRRAPLRQVDPARPILRHRRAMRGDPGDRSRPDSPFHGGELHGGACRPDRDAPVVEFRRRRDVR